MSVESALIRTRYHTDLKKAEYLGVLPEAVRVRIPKSTLYNFRNADFSSVFGMDLSNLAGNTIQVLKEIKGQTAFSKLLIGLVRVKNTLTAVKSIMLSGNGAADTIIKEKIVRCVGRVRDVLGLERAVRYFNITKTTFYSWMNQINAKCEASPLGKCLRIWPNQLTKNEIDKIKSVCLDPFVKGWPVASLAYYAARNNLLTASIATWYKYVNILGIVFPKARSRRKKTDKGIRASRPNEIIHIDVTVFKTLDNVKAYIYLIIDNFSRRILGWKASLTLSGKICLENLKEAYEKHIVKSGAGKPLGVMMDGGPENINSSVDTFFSDPESVKRIIAQHTVTFSNSVIEAYNKLLKYRRLYLHDIPNFNALVKHLETFIPVYNDIRPHYSLNGLTPREAYTSKTVDKTARALRSKEAVRARVLENRQVKCAVCPD